MRSMAGPVALMWVQHAPARTTAAMAGAVRTVIQEDEIAAVGMSTASGTTARLLSKMRLGVPLLALSQHRSTVRRMCMYYGVEPALADVPEHTRDVLDQAAELAVERGVSSPGDKLVVISGRPIGQTGATNTMVVHTIPTE